MKILVLEDDPILRKRGQLFDFNNPQEDPEKLIEEQMIRKNNNENFREKKPKGLKPKKKPKK